MSKLSKMLSLEHWKVIAILMMFYDLVAINISYLGALMLRFDMRYSMIPERYLTAYSHFAPIYSIFCILVFMYLRLYKSIWRFASYSELARVVVSSIVTTIFQALGISVFFARMPLSYYVIGAILQFVFVLGIRFSYRFVLLIRDTKQARFQGAKQQTNIMLIGAGNSGQIILRDIKAASETEGRVVCFIDDNPNKKGRYVDGVPVVGGRDHILESAQKYNVDKIYLCIPSASAEEKRDILNICKETGCKLMNLPGVYQLVNDEVSVSQMKEVAIEDLLGREQIKVNMDEIFAFIKGKVILVTGGGGSIGSELCRQIASHSPKMLIIFDVYENNAYEIQQELVRKYPNLNLVTLIGSVRDSRRISSVFETYKPDVVYHAAAHKHVPLMEVSPNEAIKNNAIGTYKTAYAAMMNGCQRFVLISTDKAVNPTNIMGASKRMCEMIIQSFDKKIKANREKDLPVLHVHTEDGDGTMFPLGPGGELRRDKNGKPIFTLPGQDGLGHRKAQTEFVAVRFGNVLGSNGSVIPLFKKQIAEGGPVTVTHPDIIRYFMTIPEAVSLVLQAGVYAKGGEIFILDMGDPVKIDTLARNLIRLSGYKPDVDIKIQYTGLRPGEKLYEEKLMAEEGMQRTANKLIHIGNPIAFDEDLFLKKLEEIMVLCYSNVDNIKEVVADMVNTYHPAK